MVRSSNRALPSGACSLLAILAGVLTLAGAPGVGLAFDDGEGDTVIGTFDLAPNTGTSRQPQGRPWVARDRPADSAGSRPPQFERLPERLPEHLDEQQLFDDALADLEAGQRNSAQRLFEILVSRHPDGDLAVEARRLLADLYRSALPEGRGAVAQPFKWSLQDRDARNGPDTAGPTSAETPRAGRSPAPGVAAGTEMAFMVDAGDRVFFSTGSADLGSRARSVLAAQARWLKRQSDVFVTIEGHADDAPLSQEQQANLAEGRAEAVRKRLIEEGIAPGRLHVAAFGRDRRIASCDTPACSAQNRRVVSSLTARGVDSQPQQSSQKMDRLPMAAGGPGPQAR